MTRSVERPPVRARSGRRPLPPLIALLVLAIVALAVWFNVFRDEADRDAAAAAACSTAAAIPSLDPTTVTLRVLNATDTQGLGGTVTAALQARGFLVSETSNDPEDVEVAGVGELRYGARGAETANYVRLFLPGVTDRTDTRATAIVDVVIGPDFQTLSSPEQIAATLAPVSSAAAAC